jgi:hypothetical protein
VPDEVIEATIRHLPRVVVSWRAKTGEWTRIDVIAGGGTLEGQRRGGGRGLRLRAERGKDPPADRAGGIPRAADRSLASRPTEQGKRPWSASVFWRASVPASRALHDAPRSPNDRGPAAAHTGSMIVLDPAMNSNV